MKNTTIIHCIEKKPTHQFEEESRIYLDSFKRTNAKLMGEVDIHFLQPTYHDISKECVNNIIAHGANYTRVPDLSTKQKNIEVNYTNKCVGGEWFSENLQTEHMCWLDLDILFLQPIEFEMFKPTDKIVISIYPLDGKYSRTFGPNTLYLHFKDYLPDEYRVDRISHYINNWFIYGKTKSDFWAEWKKLTYMLLDIIHEHHKDKIYTTDLESNCEEMATMIMHTKNPERFADIRDFYGNNTLSFRECDMDNDLTLRCKENTVIYHYNNLAGLLANNMPDYPYKRTAIKSVLAVLDIHEIPDLTVKDIISLGK